MRIVCASLALLMCNAHFAYLHGSSWVYSRDVFMSHFGGGSFGWHPAVMRRLLTPLAALTLQSWGASQVLSFYLLAAPAVYAALRCADATARHFGAREGHGAALTALFLAAHYLSPSFRGVEFFGHTLWADLTAPMFMAGLTYLAICRPRGWAYAWWPVFALGVANRETVVVALVPLALTSWRMAGASAALWIVAKVGLSHLVPGAPVGLDTAGENFAWLLSFGPSEWAFYVVVLLAGGIVFVSPTGTPEGRALLYMGALYFAAMFAFAGLLELRAFNDIAPIAAIAWAAFIARNEGVSHASA